MAAGASSTALDTAVEADRQAEKRAAEAADDQTADAVEAEAVAAGGALPGRRTRTSGAGDLFDRTGSSLTEPF